MSITPLSTQGPPTTQSSPSSGESVWQSVLAAASTTLGVSTSSLQKEVSMGQSLNSIAAAQGVSQDTLLSSIETALQQNPKLSGASSAQIDKIASQIANRTPGGHEHSHHHHGGGIDAPSADGTSSTTASTGDGSSASASVDTYA